MTYKRYKGLQSVSLRERKKKKIRKSFLNDRPLKADILRPLFKWERWRRVAPVERE